MKEKREPTLLVFCRRPRMGAGKQRIAASVGARRAYELGELLLATTIEDAADWPGNVVLAPAAPEDVEWAAGFSPRRNVLPQGEGNLGERINSVDRALREHNDAPVVFIGSDAPLLDEIYYEEARRALAAVDVVIGPAEDGGVTLMGARLPWPDLRGLPWSTPRLGDALAQCCRSMNMRLHFLPPRYDVDVAAILPRLARDLEADTRPARRALLCWLRTNGFGR